MRLMMDSFWRALAYCVHPKVIAFSILPLILMVTGVFALAYVFWDPAIGAVMAWLQGWELVTVFLAWLETVGLGALRSVWAPLIVLVVATPVIVMGSLLLVSWFMTSALVELVARRRFPGLNAQKGALWWQALLWSAGSTGLALLAVVVSVPFWLIPPLFLILPPLIWGWLTYRVFSFDVLADFATSNERTDLMRRHRYSLLAMGVITGYLGAAPALLWASGALFIALAPLLVPLAIWIYTLVFVFASLWFAHFLLAALVEFRGLPVSESAATGAPTFRSTFAKKAGPADSTVLDVSARELP